MNEEPMEPMEPRAGEELERMLARYARVRLDPSQAQARRARAAVMEQAWRQHLAAPAPAPVARRRLFGGSMRRVAVAVLAASLAGLLLGTSAFAGSRAGGPLYQARLTLEDLTLPAAGDARLQAELSRAQARVAEVLDAAARGDSNAMSAALAAYLATAGNLGDTTGPGAGRALEAIQLHRAVLQQVLADAPAAAVDGLDRALTESDRLIDRLTVTSGGNGTGPGTGGGGQGGGNAGQGGTNGGGGQNPGNPGQSGASGGQNGGRPTAKPEKAEKPLPTATTPEPTATPSAPPAAPGKPTPAPTPAPTPDAGGKPQPTSHP